MWENVGEGCTDVECFGVHVCLLGWGVCVCRGVHSHFGLYGGLQDFPPSAARCVVTRANNHSPLPRQCSLQHSASASLAIIPLPASLHGNNTHPEEGGFCLTQGDLASKTEAFKYIFLNQGTQRFWVTLKNLVPAFDPLILYPSLPCWWDSGLPS